MRDDDELIHLSGSFEAIAANAAAIDREAILRAAAALKRDEATLDHMWDLNIAALRFRGPYAIALEREISVFLATGERDGINEHLASKREELRALFKADIAQIIAEVESGE